jgi:alkylation response protein AidB-like acyl-CoA dehydrogenase
MSFTPSDEQEALRASVRRFVGERWPVAEARRLGAGEPGLAPELWAQLAELGLLGVAVPEACGGQGFGFAELALVVEELGRELAGGPYFANACLAVRALAHGAGEHEQAELLPPLASGVRIATLAALDAPGAADPDAIQCRAEGERLVGEKRYVLGAAGANLLLVAARVPGSRGADGVGLFAVEAGAAGLTVSAAPSLDLTRRFAHVRLERTPARRLGAPGSAWPALARTLAEGAIGLASEQVGAAARCLERAVEHAKQRVQFGRPIGSFQAVKHRAVDALTLVELARSAAWWSAGVAAANGAELLEAAAVAHASASEAFEKAAYECIHLHGGMGFTWQHDAHLYYRRARADRILFGDPAAHRAELSRSLGLLAAP